MKLTKRALVGAGSLAAVTAGMLAFGTGAAYAATTPPWEPDPSSVGTITFYDTNGNVITSGSTSTGPFAAYAVGSAAPRSTDAQAQILFANPDPSSTPPNWYKESAGLYTAYPLTTGPSNIQTLSHTNPVVAGGSSDQTLDGFESDSTISTTAGYQNVVQIRLRTANSANQPTATYDVADLSINPTTHTWTQIYPAAKTATTTTLTAAPSPATAGQTVTLTATETPALAGSVQFVDGSTNIGSPVAVNGSGVATTTTSWSAAGSHNLSAVFTPTDTTDNAGSTGTATEVVNPPATPTTTTLAVTQDGTAGDAATLTANVTGPGSTANTAGSVSFYDNGSTTPLNSSPVTSTTGTYTLNLASGFAAGSHSVVAKFSPTDLTAYEASQSAAQTFLTQAPLTGACAQTGSQCTDTQNIVATIPVGTLVINTPYTSSNPLNLGTLALNSTGTEFTANAPFQNIVVTDTRSGVNGVNSYTVSAISSSLTDGKSNPGSTINAQNVGLTNVSVVPGAGFAGTTAVTSNPAADPAVGPNATGNVGLGGTAKTVFTATNSTGTVTASGTLTLNAPTSTEAGLFTGTITFTVG